MRCLRVKAVSADSHWRAPPRLPLPRASLAAASVLTLHVVLQSYIAVSYKLLDPGSAVFNPLFVCSLLVSVVAASSSVVIADIYLLHASERKAKRAYVFVLAVWRAAEVVSRVLSIALMACALKGLAYFGLLIEGWLILWVGLALGPVQPKSRTVVLATRTLLKCQGSIPGHTIAARRALESSLLHTTGGEGG